MGLLAAAEKPDSEFLGFALVVDHVFEGKVEGVPLTVLGGLQQQRHGHDFCAKEKCVATLLCCERPF